jgi:pyruvate/2-oxoglutarate/acetoin dehydrogenase E1 component
LSKINSEIDELTKNALDSESPIEENPSAIADLHEPITTEQISANERSCEATILEQLNACLHDIFAENKDCFVIGEDIADPYGGAFKVTKGLSTKFPAQTISTPISENSIVGFSIGGAICGAKFIPEIMFADFVTLGMDQLINSAAKMHFMYHEQVKIPITLRLVSGGGRGYGPTHSQSTERLLAGDPGLRVVALSHLHNPYELLWHSVIKDCAPSIFVESKRLYAKYPKTSPSSLYRSNPIAPTKNAFPPLFFSPIDFQATLTIVCYGEGALLADEALDWLAMEHELFADLVVVTQISSMELGFLADSVKRTSKLLIIDQSYSDYGFSATVKSKVIGDYLGNVKIKTVSQEELPIPSSIRFETMVMPNLARVMAAINDLVGVEP